MDFPVETLCDLLECDLATGRLTWKPRPSAMFHGRKYDADRLAASWNNKNAGRSAINSLTDKGYLAGNIHRQRVLAHRVVWTFAHGARPLGWLDHINGVRSDNRIENLREATPTENSLNCGIAKNNTSGVTGVYWRARDQVWVATVGRGYRKVWLGQFDIFEDAASARFDAERCIGIFGGSRRAYVGGLFGRQG